jgi:hypothetical protein
MNTRDNAYSTLAPSDSLVPVLCTQRRGRNGCSEHNENFFLVSRRSTLIMLETFGAPVLPFTAMHTLKRDEFPDLSTKKREKLFSIQLVSRSSQKQQHTKQRFRLLYCPESDTIKTRKCGAQAELLPFFHALTRFSVER